MKLFLNFEFTFLCLCWKTTKNLDLDEFILQYVLLCLDPPKWSQFVQTNKEGLEHNLWLIWQLLSNANFVPNHKKLLIPKLDYLL